MTFAFYFFIGQEIFLFFLWMPL